MARYHFVITRDCKKQIVAENFADDIAARYGADVQVYVETVEEVPAHTQTAQEYVYTGTKEASDEPAG